MRLTVVEPAMADLGLSVEIDVLATDDEMRELAADVPRLTALARATGGQVIPPADLRRLLEPGVVENLSRQTANDVSEPVGRSGWVLGLIVGLLGVEWVGRKLVRLV